MGTALSRSESVTDLSLKAEAYDVAAASVDGMDVLAVADAARLAVDYVREGRPYFLECRTYRFRAHSMFDAELYRPKNEIAEWKRRDPITLFVERMGRAGRLTEADRSELEHLADRETAEAVAFAEAGGWEPVADLNRFVTSEKQAP
jgi:TPP-dependent pyruvate/acetoin dehydrogenase alpha subunit